MFEIEVTYKDGQPVDKLTCTSAICELGKARTGLIRLRGWKVAPIHARIEQSLAGLFVEDVSRGYEVRVNDRAVSRHGSLTPDDVIAIGGYLVRVQCPQHAERDADPRACRRWRCASGRRGGGR